MIHEIERSNVATEQLDTSKQNNLKEFQDKTKRGKRLTTITVGAVLYGALSMTGMMSRNTEAFTKPVKPGAKLVQLNKEESDLAKSHQEVLDAMFGPENIRLGPPTEKKGKGEQYGVYIGKNTMPSMNISSQEDKFRDDELGKDVYDTIYATGSPILDYKVPTPPPQNLPQ